MHQKPLPGRNPIRPQQLQLAARDASALLQPRVLGQGQGQGQREEQGERYRSEALCKKSCGVRRVTCGVRNVSLDCRGPLGTHGYINCAFDSVVNQHDKLAARAWRSVCFDTKSV